MSTPLDKMGFAPLGNALMIHGNFNNLSSLAVSNAPKRGMVFHKVHDWDSETMWISDKMNNGDFDYRFVMVATDWRDATNDNAEPHWNVTLKAVSTQAAGLREVVSALKSAGIDLSYCKRDDKYRELALYVELYSYGCAAVLSDVYGENLKKLIKKTREEALKASVLFGFYMDRTMNAIGDTGWDWISGNVAGSKDRRHKKYLEAHGKAE